MKVKINLARAERVIAPDGRYLCTITKCEQRRAKNNNPMIWTEFTPDPEAHPDYSSVRFYMNNSLLEQSWFRVLDLVKAALGDVSPQNDDGDFEFDPAELVSSPVVVDVKVDDTYDGTPRNVVVNVFPPEEMYPEEEVDPS